MTTWVAVAALPLLIVLVVVSLREPLRIALPVYAALIPFGGALAVGSSRFTSASSVMGLLLALGLVLRLAKGPRPASRLSVAVPIWVLFLSLAAATTLWTINRAATLSGLAVLCSLVVVFLLVTLSQADRAVVRRTETALLLGSAAAVGYGVFQIAFAGGLVDDTGAAIEAGGRLGNGLVGPNILAVTLLIPFAIAVNRTFNPLDPGRPLPNGLLAAIMVAGILMTGSRTGVLGAGVVALAMMWVAPRGARRGMAGAMLVAAVATVFVWTVHPFGIANRTFESTTSSSGRLEIWQVGLAACADYCGVGSGWGTFPDVYAETQASVAGARVLTGEGGSYQAHNLWLLVVVELGVVGLVLFTLGLVACAVAAFRLPQLHRVPAVGAVVGLTVGVFFLSSLEFKMFWLVMMLVSLYWSAVRVEESEAEERATAQK